MSETTEILWGIDRPDHSPVTSSTTQGSAFWTGRQGQYGFPVNRRDCAEAGAEELTERLVRLGVARDAAEHETVRIVITTNVDRQIDWLPEPSPPREELDMQASHTNDETEAVA